MTNISPQYPASETLGRRLYRSLIAAHRSVESPVERRGIELLAALSLSFAVVVLIGVTAALSFSSSTAITTAGYIVSGVAFGSYALSRGLYYHYAPALFVGGFSIAAYIAVLAGDEPALFLTLSAAIIFLLSNLFDLKRMAWVIGLNYIVIVALVNFFLPEMSGMETLNAHTGIFSVGVFVLLFAWHRRELERLRLDEIARAHEELKQSNAELQASQRKAAVSLQGSLLAAEVGRAISQVRDLDSMLADAANLIRSRFDLYYVQIYLTNPDHTHLILHAGTGDAGADLLNRRHQLMLDANSINGRAAIEHRSLVVQNVSADPFFQPNPLLPETRSEMAVPLLTGGTTMGTLDLQSDKPGQFIDEMLPAFEALAGQLSIAVQNARSFEQSQEKAELEERVNIIGQKIQRATTVEDALQTAVRELGQALGASRVKATIAAHDDGRSN